MPSSTLPENTPAANPERMGDIIRLVRRICLLREDGDMLRARRMEESELRSSVDSFRKLQGDDALPDRALAEIFTIEEHRVSEAGILCELLVPRLAARLPAAGSAGTAAAVPMSRPAMTVATPSGPPAIPDLLDAMLALDRADARRSPAARSKF